jgi:hypothetical protein
MLEMMLEKEWSCNLFEMLSLSVFNPLLANCMKGGMHVIMSKGRSFCTIFKWAWKGNGLKLLAPIAFNKNG